MSVASRAEEMLSEYVDGAYDIEQLTIFVGRQEWIQFALEVNEHREVPLPVDDLMVGMSHLSYDDIPLYRLPVHSFFAIGFLESEPSA